MHSFGCYAFPLAAAGGAACSMRPFGLMAPCRSLAGPHQPCTAHPKRTHVLFTWRGKAKGLVVSNLNNEML